MKRKAVVSIVLAAALLAACSSSQTGKTGSAASSAASVTETAAEETEETAIEDTAESAVSQSTETESTAAADTGSDTNMNVSMQTSNEYSSVIPAVSDYFTETPYENVESDAGLAVMWDTCNMDEVRYGRMYNCCRFNLLILSGFCLRTTTTLRFFQCLVDILLRNTESVCKRVL